MELELFEPDNFSQIDIRYKIFDGNAVVLRNVLGLYFSNFEIKEICQLDRPEINSKNFKINLYINGQNRCFLLRKYQILSDLEQIIFYLDKLPLLERGGVKVSRVVRSLEGHLAVKEQKDIYALFDFIEGDYFSPNEQGFSMVAKEIAALHSAFYKFDKKQIEAIDSFSKKSKTYYNVIRSYSEKDLLEIEAVIKTKKIDQGDRLVLENLPFIKENIIEVRNKLKGPVILRRQIIHSDLHPHNIIMKKNEVAAIIDFDSMRLSERARDIAFAIYRFGRQFLVGCKADDSFLVAPRLTKLFINSYNEIDKISEEEINLMPALIKDEFLLKILFVLNGIYKDGNFLWASDLKKFLAAMQEINYFWPNG